MRSPQVTECSLELEELTPGVTQLQITINSEDKETVVREGGKSQSRLQRHRVPGTQFMLLRCSRLTGASCLWAPRSLHLKFSCPFPLVASRLLASLSHLFLPWSGRLHAQGRVLNPD